MVGKFEQYSIELFQNNSSVIHLRTIILKLNSTEHLGQNHQSVCCNVRSEEELVSGFYLQV